MRSFTPLALIAACFAVGCVDNSILEITVDLPPEAVDEAAPVYAIVEARSARSNDFDLPWFSSGLVDGALLESVRTERTFSVVALPADYDDDLLMRVTFCRSPQCLGLGTPELPDLVGERRLRLERPFFDGVRTAARWRIEEVPRDTVEAVDMIGRCSIEGCGDTGLESYCDGTRHFCE